jgi:uncharacterized membrane protein YkoI
MLFSLNCQHLGVRWDQQINNQPRKESNMKVRLGLLIAVPALALVAAGSLAGCASTQSGKAQKEEDVTLAQMSEPARATVKKEIAGGQVDKITKEIERGKTVYDVEATVGGKHMEYLIADADGELLGTEVPIEFSQLPEAVRAAAEKHFGTSTGLTVMKGVEYGETHYEIEGPKNGKTEEVTFDSAGKRGK